MNKKTVTALISRELTEKELEIGRQFFEELNKGVERLRKKGFMTWLLNVASMNLEDLSSGDWENLKFEITYLALFGFPQKKVEVTPISFLYHELHLTPPGKVKELSGGITEWKQTVVGPYHLPSKEEVAEFQRLTQKQLDQLESDNTVEFDLKGVTLTCHRTTDRKASWMSFSYERIQDALMAQVGRLIFPHISKIRGCLECEKYFYPIRSTKKYCSIRCQNRVSKRKQLERAKTKKGG